MAGSQGEDTTLSSAQSVHSLTTDHFQRERDGELHQQDQAVCGGHGLPAGQDSAGPGLYTGRQTGLMEED